MPKGDAPHLKNCKFQTHFRQLIYFCNSFFTTDCETKPLAFNTLIGFFFPLNFSSSGAGAHNDTKLHCQTYTAIPGGPEGVFLPKLYMDVPAGFLRTNFSHNYPLISISFSKEKHLILLKLGASYHNLLKIHLIYVIWAPSSW